MLQEINTSLGPIKEDFDRYLAWEHRKSRLEEDLYFIDTQLSETLDFGFHEWKERWVAILLGQHFPETFLPDRERLSHARLALQQQIELLDRQMSQAGDPRDLYHELLALKKEWLIEAGHRQGIMLQQISLEIEELEAILADYNPLQEILKSAHQAVQTLWMSTHKLVNSRPLSRSLSLMPRRYRAALHRVRRSTPIANALMQQVGARLTSLPDYAGLPANLQAGHFLHFPNAFRDKITLSQHISQGKASPLGYLEQILQRLEALTEWIEINKDAHSQRARFLRHKQERIIRQAD